MRIKHTKAIISYIYFMIKITKGDEHMTKNKKHGLILVFFLGFILTLIFCSATFSAAEDVFQDIERIELIKQPTRTTIAQYYEIPDPRGAILRVFHKNGVYQDIKINDYNFTGDSDILQTQVLGFWEVELHLSWESISSPGTYAVTLTYMGKSCTYDVTVVEKQIKTFSIKRFCDGTESICLTYEDGTNEEVEIIRHDSREGASFGYNPNYCYQTGPLLLKDRILPEMKVKYVIQEKATTYTLYGAYTGEDFTFVLRDVDDRSHHFGDWYETTPATCTKTGFETRKCVDCEESESKETKGTTHSFGQWTVTKPATVDVEGTETRTCSGCGYAESRSLAKLAASSSEPMVETTPPSTDDQIDVSTDSAEQEAPTEKTDGLQTEQNSVVSALSSDAAPKEESSVSTTVIVTATSTAALIGIGGCLWKFLLHKKI